MKRLVTRVVAFFLIGFFQLMFFYDVIAQVPVPLAPAPDANAVGVLPAPASLPVPFPVPLPAPVVAPVAPDQAVVAAPIALPLPVAAPLPAPVVASVIPVAAPVQAPVVPVVPVLATSPASSSVPEKYKKEFDDINESMNRIKVLEDEIKAAFAGFDDKMTQARNIDLAIKESSFDILKQDSEQKARELFTKIEGQMKDLKEIQKFGQGDFTKVNTDKIAEINMLIVRVNGILQQLQTLVTVAATTQPAVTTAPAGQAQSVADKSKVAASDVVTVEQKTFVVRAWDWTVDTLVSGIMSFNRVIDSMTSWIRPQQKKKALKSQIDESTPLIEVQKKTKEFVGESDKIISPLESLYFDFVQKFQETSKEIRSLNKTISTMPLLKEYLMQQNGAPQKNSPPWKKAIVQMFSKVIDLGIAIADIVIVGVKWGYSHTVAPMINVFRSDVEKKMQIIEQGK